MKKYGIDICCLQETKLVDDKDKDIEEYNCQFINVKPECKHYGNGFVVAPKWKNNVVKYWKVSDRIIVIQLRLKEG